MKTKTMIFRAGGANGGLVHVVYVKGPKGNYYEVIKARKKVDGVNRYWTMTSAIQAAIDQCIKDIMIAQEGGLL